MQFKLMFIDEACVNIVHLKVNIQPTERTLFVQFFENRSIQGRVNDDYCCYSTNLCSLIIVSCDILWIIGTNRRLISHGKYCRTSMARTLMARLPWLFPTRS